MRLAACVLVQDWDQVLCVPCKYGGYSLPGGKVEPGESPADAARRECIEETGLDPGPISEDTHLRFSQRHHSFTGEWRTSTYLCAGDLQLVQSDVDPEFTPIWLHWDTLIANSPYREYLIELRAWSLRG